MWKIYIRKKKKFKILISNTLYNIKTEKLNGIEDEKYHIITWYTLMWFYSIFKSIALHDFYWYAYYIF